MGSELVVEAPKIVDRIDENFPAIDFRFSNEGRAGAMIWKFEIDVLEASIDERPVMEYSLGVSEKALLVYVANYGWGPCINLNMSVDLRTTFGKSIKRDPAIHWGGSVYEFTEVKLATIDDMDFSTVPESLKLTESDDRLSVSGRNEKLYWEAQRYIQHNGIGSLPAQIEYQDIEGNVYTERESIERVQRGAYDWHRIYLYPDGFREVPYDRGIRYLLLRPSCFYHVVLDPARGRHVRSFNVSHVISSGDFERFFIVLASEVSSEYELRFRFHIDDGEVLESQTFAVQIWNPKSTVYHRYGEPYSEQEEPFSIGPSLSFASPMW